jgi:hypothetical protein
MVLYRQRHIYVSGIVSLLETTPVTIESSPVVLEREESFYMYLEFTPVILKFAILIKGYFQANTMDEKKTVLWR